MIYKLDYSDEKVYWFIEANSTYGTKDPQQITESVYPFVEFTDRNAWIAYLLERGIVVEEETTDEPA